MQYLEVRLVVALQSEPPQAGPRGLGWLYQEKSFMGGNGGSHRVSLGCHYKALQKVTSQSRGKLPVVPGRVGLRSVLACVTAAWLL